MGDVDTPSIRVVRTQEVQLDCLPLEKLVAEAIEAVASRARQIVFACANVHSVVLARSDPAFREALAHATHLVPDGIGVLLAARAKGVAIGRRTTGADYFAAISQALAGRGQGKIYFLGSTKEVLSRICRRFAAEYPDLQVCGSYSPPFGAWTAEENERLIDDINGARPDVLWVGMTAPRQEIWIEENRQSLDVPLIGAIGAVFDFYAGTKRRAPEWMRRWGFEWVYRFLQEPRRTWRRHFVSIPKFLVLITLRQLTFSARNAGYSYSSKPESSAPRRHGVK